MVCEAMCRAVENGSAHSKPAAGESPAAGFDTFAAKTRAAPLSVLILKLQVVEAHQVAVLDAHGLQPVEQTALA